MIGLRLGHTPESDHALPLERNRVAPDECVVAVLGLHKTAVRALVHEHEAVLCGLDTRVQARDQVALDHKVVFLAAAERRERALPVVEHELRSEVAQPDAELLLQFGDRGDRRQHAGRLAVLPEHFEDGDFLVLAARNRNIDPARHGAPLVGHALLDCVRDDDLAGLGLARHAVRRMYRGAEHVAGFDHDRAEMAADPDRDLLALDFEIRMPGDRRLHLDRGVDGRIAVDKRRHDLVAHGLDDGAAVLLGRAAHDLDADRDLVARDDVTQHFEQPGAADDVGEENREFLVLPHAGLASPTRIT